MPGPSLEFCLPRVFAWSLLLSGLNLGAQALSRRQKWLSRFIPIDQCQLHTFAASGFQLGIWLPLALLYLLCKHSQDDEAIWQVI
jgi:hypothetical protein